MGEGQDRGEAMNHICMYSYSHDCAVPDNLYGGDITKRLCDGTFSRCFSSDDLICCCFDANGRYDHEWENVPIRQRCKKCQLKHDVMIVKLKVEGKI